MAFHVACPITCEPICYCELGFPGSLRRSSDGKGFLDDVLLLQELLLEPWLLRSGGRERVQVEVPRIELPSPAVVEHKTCHAVAAAAAVSGSGEGGGHGGGSPGVMLVAEEGSSLAMKRAAMQKRALEASAAAEDYARRLENGEPADLATEATRDGVMEDQPLNVVKVICRMCFNGENEGSVRASRMLSCKSCNKKYHKNCLRKWSLHRDLFDWSSWLCPSCRSCEVCRRAGDPTRLMFCKRCDGPYHSYCQHPPHKNVTDGPYLCPKHTWCHSCGSKVPGNGLSTRWFLSYTFCDACGRLFMKKNYCPVCLKVYRDSEPTPMVRCDDCLNWVHIECDSISDEKYQQFERENLPYKCPACRGGCYQVQSFDDAIREIWRRRDLKDRDKITSLRAAAGLPKEINSASPYSDDENCLVVSKNDGKSLKFSFKGISSSVDQGNKHVKSKKYPKNKGANMNSDSHSHLDQYPEPSTSAQLLEDGLVDEKVDTVPKKTNGIRINLSRNRLEGSTKSYTLKQHDHSEKSYASNSIENYGNRGPKGNHVTLGGPHGLGQGKSSKKVELKAEPVKGKKLVIHFASRNKTSVDASRSDTSNRLREQDSAASMGSEETSKQAGIANEVCQPDTDLPNFFTDNKNRKGIADPPTSNMSFAAEDSFIKGNVIHEEPDLHVPPNKTVNGLKDVGKTVTKPVTKFVTYEKRGSDKARGNEGGTSTRTDMPARRNSARDEDVNKNLETSASAPAVVAKPPLRLKFRNISLENQSSWTSLGDEDEKSSIKGQRSKRKRPSLMVNGLGNSISHDETPIDQNMDAGWILKKLGKDAIGKRVEVHHPSEDSWHKGVVSGVVNNKSALSIRLDSGGNMTLELGKQGVRFIPQKQKTKK